MYQPDVQLFVLVDWGLSFSVYRLANRGSTGDFRLLYLFSGVVCVATGPRRTILWFIDNDSLMS